LETFFYDQKAFQHLLPEGSETVLSLSN